VMPDVRFAGSGLSRDFSIHVIRPAIPRFAETNCGVAKTRRRCIAGTNMRALPAWNNPHTAHPHTALRTSEEARACSDNKLVVL